MRVNSERREKSRCPISPRRHFLSPSKWEKVADVGLAAGIALGLALALFYGFSK